MLFNRKIKVIMSNVANDFLDSLQQDVKDKIISNVDKIANGFVDKDIFKKIVGTDIWEFRTKYKGMQYRLLAFWDTRVNTIVVATHGFTKKTKNSCKGNRQSRKYYETIF